MAESLILDAVIVLDRLAEVKCPATKFQVTPLEACQDPNCFCEAVNGHCKLKRNHGYYMQVQGHMGASGALWCDFIVYTKKGISMERIPFDAAYWATLKQKLKTYYLLELQQVSLQNANLPVCKQMSGIGITF